MTETFDAFSQGIGMYEAISAIVQPTHQNNEEGQVTLHVMTLHSSLTNNFVETLSEA